MPSREQAQSKHPLLRAARLAVRMAGERPSPVRVRTTLEDQQGCRGCMCCGEGGGMSSREKEETLAAAGGIAAHQRQGAV